MTEISWPKCHTNKIRLNVFQSDDHDYESAAEAEHSRESESEDACSEEGGGEEEEEQEYPKEGSDERHPDNLKDGDGNQVCMKHN